MKKSLFTLALLLLLLPQWAGIQGQTRPVQLALFTPIQVFPENVSIEGVRVNILYGRNRSLTGLDLGFVNHLSGGDSKGIQFGLVGIVEGNFTGWMDNTVNYTKGKMEGLQFGFFNYAGKASGVQIGLVNYAENMRGLQIGLINVIRNNGAFPVFPIVNWSF